MIFIAFRQQGFVVFLAQQFAAFKRRIVNINHDWRLLHHVQGFFDHG